MPVIRQDLQPFLPRFLAALEKTSTCWYLAGRARSNGYTVIQINGVKMSGHRFAYAAFVADIPDRGEIDHLCRDRACVNPAHLELVTRSENLRRRDTSNTEPRPRSLLDRLLARRSIDYNGCWLWIGAKVRGYGVISVEKQTRYVHRIAHELMIEPLSEGATIDHLCRKPACFNPAHLEAVTRTENTRRVPQAGRRHRTCRNGHIGNEVGSNPDGSCAACHPERARKRAPRRPRDEIGIRCTQGHLYAELGRYPSGGCIACQLVKDQARRKGPRPPTRICPKGHDTAVAGRRGQNGECRECSREYARKKYGYARTADELRTTCRNGHQRTDTNTRLITRMRQSKQRSERLCLDCRQSSLARYASKKPSVPEVTR